MTTDTVCLCGAPIPADRDACGDCSASTGRERGDCVCCDEPDKPGAPGAGGAPWICDECATP